MKHPLTHKMQRTLFQGSESEPLHNIFRSLVSSTSSENLEKILIDNDYFPIIGVDEAGRGPLAGPVVACACILPLDCILPGLTDSKKCSPKKRDELYEALIHLPGVEYALSIVSHDEIDRVNILQATMNAMSEAILKLSQKTKCILIDGNKLPNNIPESIPSHAVVKGDMFISSISAASIIAKVTRDRIVDLYDETWPHFEFRRHKGYGTELHVQLLEKYGPLPIHRKTFQPVKGMIEKMPHIGL